MNAGVEVGGVEDSSLQSLSSILSLELLLMMEGFHFLTAEPGVEDVSLVAVTTDGVIITFLLPAEGFGVEIVLIIDGIDLETGIVLTVSDFTGSLMNVRPLPFLFSAKQFLMLIPNALASSLVSVRVSLEPQSALPATRILRRAEMVEDVAGTEIPIAE